MVNTFIDDVLLDLIQKQEDLSQLTFVLPSKRAGNFLRNAIPRHTNKTIFSPNILSIEEFVEDIASIKAISNTELLFEFYDVYLELTPKEQLQDFEAFCKWAQIILQDFNEVDRHLVAPNEIFSYLSAIKEVDHWSLTSEKSDLITNYLSFWKKLPQCYNKFTEKLIDKGKGHQGLVYRQAVEKLEIYAQFNSEKKHVFLGFNALNTAEQTIMKELLHLGIAYVYWDVDANFMNNPHHDVGHFARTYSSWKFYEKHPFTWVQNHYKTEKNIHAIGVPKNVGQVKHVGELLSQMEKSNNLNNTAVVLGDEMLLLPLLNSIPKGIGPVNVTMGMPLQQTPLASLFNSLFLLHKTGYTTNKVYFKDAISILSNPYIAQILNYSEANTVHRALHFISDNNITHLSIKKLRDLFQANPQLIDLLFGDWKNDSAIGLENCKSIINIIKSKLQADNEDYLLAKEYLFKFNQVFNQAYKLISDFGFAKDLKSMKALYKEILASETLDFQGEPLKGLQIMGVLESRAIDFETVIITSVNEGVLPSGKSQNSFIPFDVKMDYDLPTYKEKDAIYAYHFYHLLQRAKNVYILYNTEVDALKGGEKSRFISQLEVEAIHDIKSYNVAPIVPLLDNECKRVKKTSLIMERLKDIASKGFSPSALTSYIRNPIDFYFNKILGVNAYEDVEETIAYNTHGTIIHNTLEDLYTPYLHQPLTTEALNQMKARIDVLTRKNFNEVFKDGDTTTGKNLIALQITKRYVSNYIDHELESLKKGHTIKILGLEQEVKEKIMIPELDFPVFIRGSIDRIDVFDGITRVIDYKTGNVSQGQVEVVEWQDITTDYEKYSKSFQILSYAYLLQLQKPFDKPMEAGIISFKNLKSGLLRFSKKDSPRSRNKDYSINEELLTQFSAELKRLIIEICNPDLDFIEKDI